MPECGDTLRIRNRGPAGSRRIELYIGDVSVISTSRDVVRALELEDGQHIEEESLCSSVCAEEPIWIRERALRLLSYRERSHSELRQRLEDDGYDPEAIHAILTALEDSDLLNDDRFSGAYVRTKIAAGWGRRRISNGLLKSGIDPDRIDKALTADYPDDDQSRAESLIDTEGIRTTADASRAMARLVRRGFDQSIAREVVWKALRTNQNGSSEVH